MTQNQVGQFPKLMASFPRQVNGWCQLLIPLGHSGGIIAPLRLLAGFPGYTGLSFALEKELGSSGKVDP